MKKELLPLKKYKKILSDSPVCCVDVMYFNKDHTKTLLFKRENEPLKGIYFASGGRLLKNETLIDGAARQAMREVGIKTKKNNLFLGGFQEEIHPNSIFKNTSYHAVVVFYGYIINEETFTPRMDKQHSDFKWFSIKDKKLHPFIKSRLKLIFNKNEKGL